MSRKPRIAVACNMDTPGPRTICGVISRYMEALLAAGGAPFIVPMTSDKGLLNEYLDVADGVFVPGGIDVCPNLYGESPDPNLGRTDVELDEFQLSLIRLAHERFMPICGVCRGVQVMNVAFGGTLVQHVGNIPGAISHRQQNTDGDRPYHKLRAEENSFIAEVFGVDFGVNSFHHQAAKAVAPGFRITSHAPDGIIESLERIDNEHWEVGVQWHPERMIYKETENLELFKRFVTECRKRSRR